MTPAAVEVRAAGPRSDSRPGPRASLLALYAGAVDGARDAAARVQASGRAPVAVGDVAAIEVARLAAGALRFELPPDVAAAARRTASTDRRPQPGRGA